MKIEKDSTTGKRFVEEVTIEENEQETGKQSPGQLKKVSLEDFDFNN